MARCLRFGVLLALASVVFGAGACDALFGDPVQCTTDADCAWTRGQCGSDGICVAHDDAGSGPTLDATEATGRVAITPAFVTVAAGGQQAFAASVTAADGGLVAPPPAIEWSVSGGGTIAASGVFTAGAVAGGPFTVTAKAGSLTGTASVTVTKTETTVTMGETNILGVDISGTPNVLLVQEATLDQEATLKSLSLYVATAAGKLRLGVYDATGSNGGPGTKKAETDEFAAVAGWMAVPVATPVLLAAGTYWLALLSDDGGLAFRRAGDGTGRAAFASQAYGPLPMTFSPTTRLNEHSSFYATLTR